MKTQNGYPVNPGAFTTHTAHGHRFVARADAPGQLLKYVAHRFGSRVEAIVTANGARSLKLNTQSGGIATSNHLSGTALDLNGRAHPRNRANTFTLEQQSEIRQILIETGHLVRWGGNYPSSYVDDMHWEIVANLAACKAKIAAMQAPIRDLQRAVRLPATGNLEAVTIARVNAALTPPMSVTIDRWSAAQRQELQRAVGAFPDSYYGPNSLACHRATIAVIQRALGVRDDSMPGPVTNGAWTTTKANLENFTW